MKTALILTAALGLAACGSKPPIRHPEPVIVTVEKAVAVDAPCVPNTLAPRPKYVDNKAALTAAADAAERMQLLYAGRAQRDARLNEIEPVLEGCPRGEVKKK